MLEIRRLKKNESAPPPGAPWILIEKQQNLYFLKARSKDGPIDAALSWRTGVKSARLAIKNAETWADLLAVEAIYVRDDHE